MPRDYYEILGISRNASDEEIKKSYRRLAKKYHPDVCSESDATAKFKEISEAYQVLGDPNRRSDYDTFGTADAGSDFGGFGGFDDLFSMFFGDFDSGGRPRSAAERGADLILDLEIGFKEAVFGTEKKVNVEKLVRCSTCDGTGAKSGTMTSTCSNCGGSGQMKSTQRTLLGNFVRSYPCTHCQGSGEIIASPCPRCSGQGRKPEKSTIALAIPAGIVHGMRLRMNGKGQAGRRGGPPGDFYATIHVKAHELFERDGDDLFCQIPLTISQAGLGARIEVPTLNDNYTLEIPSGTQGGAVFRLKGKGVPRLGRRGRGDQVVMVKVEVPTKLNKEQQDLLKELAKAGGEDLNSLSPGFLNKLKKIL
jgi:molecular chaperone DnaJ